MVAKMGTLDDAEETKQNMVQTALRNKTGPRGVLRFAGTTSEKRMGCRGNTWKNRNQKQNNVTIV